MSESKDLLNGFSAITDKVWREKIIADLKGKDFEETLQWKDENELLHQPYYRSSNIENNTIVKQIQAAQKENLSWKSIQTFPSKEKNLKKKIEAALNGGIDEVVIDNVSDAKSMKEQLGEALKDSASIHLHLTKLAQNSLPKTYFFDPIGEMLRNNERDEDNLDSLRHVFQKRLNQLKPDNFLLVDGSLYRNAGATIVQELAFTLHHAVEYFDILTESGYTPDAISRSFTFKLGYGTSYFSEIAKSRAFRFLIKKVYESYKISSSEIRVWGEASPYYLTHKDPYTNLLRLSSQCMSAILGNCDLISLPSYDHWGGSSTLGYRMSKNIPLILKNESYFNQVKDLTAGSYYIESISADIAEKAWELFLQTEKQGSLLDQLENQTLSKLIEKSKEVRKSSYQNEKRTMIGVNKFINPEATDLDVDSKKNKGLSNSILSKEITS